jgi:hypothetical protein
MSSEIETSEAVSIPVPIAPLPAWGELYDDIHGEIEKGFPSDWRSTTGDSTAQRQAHFEKWRDDHLARINRLLWPRYDRRTHSWVGESARFMEELTDADLKLMLQIQNPHTTLHFDMMPTLPSAPSVPLTNRQLFVQEDHNDAEQIYQGFGSYFQATDATVQTISSICDTSEDTKEIPVNYWFKSQLQRARAWQMALRFKIDNFVYLEATSAMTPSMCSGHCLQSLIAVGTVIERVLDEHRAPDQDMIAALAHWAVDVGDRRVMGGVHYPSDNICSWFLFFSMCEFVFHRPEVKHVMAQAIVSHSFIYDEIQRFKCTSAGNIYRTPLALLEPFVPQVSG